MFKKLFFKFQFEKINSIILCMRYFILMKTKKKKELPVTVYIQLQKRLTWLEQLTALFLFQLHYNRFMRKKKMYHISDLIQEKTNWPYLSFMPFFIRHRICLYDSLQLLYCFHIMHASLSVKNSIN